MARSQVGAAQCVQPKSLPGFYLRPDAAAALDRACKAFGKRLIVTGALRSYDTQVRLFTSRYRVQWVGDGAYGDVRWWKGKRYVRKFGTAAAAVPGTSNHGSGDAIDVKTRRDKSDPSHEVAVVFTSWSDRDRVAFLKAAAPHGWDDDEGQRVDELWHITYYPERDKHAAGGKPAQPSTGKRAPHRVAKIKRGSRGWRVRLWQAFLRETGDLRGKVDGVFGPVTEAATKRWQRRAKLTADGVVGPKTWFRACCGVKKGRRGARVKVAQRMLGFTGKAVDGVAGANTDRRIREVQRYLGVKADGVIGPKTMQALLRKA